MYGEEKPIAYLQLLLSKKRTSVILLFQMFMRKLAGNKVFVCVAAAEFLILSQMRNLQHKQNLSPLRKTMDLIYIIFLFQMFCKKYELIIVFIQYYSAKGCFRYGFSLFSIHKNRGLFILDFCDTF